MLTPNIFQIGRKFGENWNRTYDLSVTSWPWKPPELKESLLKISKAERKHFLTTEADLDDRSETRIVWTSEWSKLSATTPTSRAMTSASPSASSVTSMTSLLPRRRWRNVKTSLRMSVQGRISCLSSWIRKIDILILKRYLLKLAELMS